MTEKQKENETIYRLCVIKLENLLLNGVMSESEYDEFRVQLAKHLAAPFGMLESEDMLWKKEL